MLRIYNTLTKKKEDFKPINPPKVTFYQCGPTVYWVQHLGNMRAMVLADLIKRSFDYLGYKVELARNYTDVGHLVSDEDDGDDKMSKTARLEKTTPEKIAEKYIEQFDNDIKALNCLKPNYCPKATDYIEEMKKMVQGLLDKGFAYATDSAIYFEVAKFEKYTELSGRKLEKDRSEAGKGEVSDPQKKQPADFVIWFFKTGVHANALQTWPYQFTLADREISGEGFPGWHLECSAMNQAIFGPTIDLHMGGIEHVSVHHSNEIAQSEAFSGQEFVKYWIHNEHLTVDGGKMSKSEGTAYSLQDVIDRGYDPLVVRYFFLSAHYRSKQNFTWTALDASQVALEKLKRFVKDNLEYLSLFKDGKIEESGKEKIVEDFKQKFISALEDDFNLPQALAIIWEILKSDNYNGDKLKTILDFDQVLGLNLAQLETEEIPEKIKALAEARWQARAEKNWSEADKLRDELSQLGWEMEDGKDSYKLNKIS